MTAVAMLALAAGGSLPMAQTTVGTQQYPR